MANDDKDSVAFWYEKARQLEEQNEAMKRAVWLAIFFVTAVTWVFVLF